MRRQDRKFTRKKQLREINKQPTALIVCEGKETEPNYIRGLINYLKIHPKRIDVVYAKHPNAVVRHAIEKKTQFPGQYDEVFAVFDGDHQKLEEEKSSARKNNIQSILSIPCFEVWILLHHESNHKPYPTCEPLTNYLSKNYNYKKNDFKIFDKLKDFLPTAEQNAKNLALHNEKNECTSPSTNMHVLIEKLRNF